MLRLRCGALRRLELRKALAPLALNESNLLTRARLGGPERNLVRLMQLLLARVPLDLSLVEAGTPSDLRLTYGPFGVVASSRERSARVSRLGLGLCQSHTRLLDLLLQQSCRCLRRLELCAAALELRAQRVRLLLLAPELAALLTCFELPVLLLLCLSHQTRLRSSSTLGGSAKLGFRPSQLLRSLSQALLELCNRLAVTLCRGHRLG